MFDRDDGADGGVLVGALGAAVDAIAAWDPAGAPPGALLDAVVGLRAVRDRLDAVVARVGAVVESQGEWRADGSRSLAARLAREAGEPEHVARRDVRLGRALAGMPLTATALARGSVSRAHADQLAHAAGGARRELFVRDEALLVGFAAELDGTAFAAAVRAWVHAADDALAPPDPGTAIDPATVAVDARRHATRFPTFDGRWRYHLEFDRLGGAEFTAAFDHVERELFEADWAEARTRLGRDPLPAELRRTPRSATSTPPPSWPAAP
jgi:hypothetical protein